MSAMLENEAGKTNSEEKLQFIKLHRIWLGYRSKVNKKIRLINLKKKLK